MTTTTTRDALTVTRTVTQADAQLIVSLMNGPLGLRASDGMSLLITYDGAPTYAQFVADHPVGSKGHQDVTALLAMNETIGTFVKQGLLDRALVHDLFWIEGAWKKSEQLALHFREQAGEPRIYENFEALASTA